jgi:hypothetical protein
MRKLFAALIGVLLPAVIFVSVAGAVPSTVNLRIEGKDETLFEGRVPTSIEKIKASSDSDGRDCDGVNELDPWNSAPGVTPTLASVEAMESIGETFDGKWYPGFDDYFITRWGPDAQVPAENAYWGILVNGTYTNVGGCQYQLDENDEALWVWDAFNFRPTLALFPEAAHYTGGPRPTRAVAEVGEPFDVEVVEYPDNGSEGVPCDEPTRAGSNASRGATVAPVTVNPKGFQRIDTGSPEAATTDIAGKTALTFETPGIHRIKATVGEPGSETTDVRSNGLEVCVPGGAVTCTGFATPPSSGATKACHATAPATGGGPSQAAPAPSPPAPPASTGTLKVSAPKLDRGKLSAGKVGVSWKVLEAGPGIKRWTISSQAVGQKHARWVTRASGAMKTTTTLSLPRGHTYKLRFAITDADGATSTLGLGQVKVPEPSRGRR